MLLEMENIFFHHFRYSYSELKINYWNKEVVTDKLDFQSNRIKGSASGK